ncbi:MAG: hypothetical protein V1746_05780 [bacterium]
MKRLRHFFIGFSLIVLVAFFLPWARPLLEVHDPFSLREKLLEGEANFVQSYILMPRSSWNEIWRNPAEGVSGYQMVSSDSLRARLLAQTVSENLFGSLKDWRMKLAAIPPIAALICLFVALQSYPSYWWLMGPSLAQALFYAAVRWEINRSDFLRLELSLGAGLWLTLYGSLLLALIGFFVAHRLKMAKRGSVWD